MSNSNTFSTTNRRLEQFLFIHKIHFLYHRKNEDGMTSWTYAVNDEFTEVLQEYKRIYQNNRAS